MQACIRVVLADSYRMVAGSLCRDLDQDSHVEVVSLVTNAQQAVAVTIQDQPQVVVVDTELDGGGIWACRQMIVACPTTAVLVISSFDWDIYLAQAWALGAIGFMTKCDTLDDLLRSIRQAQRAKPLFTAEQLYRIQLWQRDIAPQLDALTSREWQVLNLVVAGKSNRQIADALSLAESTVAKHITALLQKTELDSRHALISFAHQHHITYYTHISPTSLARGAALQNHRS